MLLAQMPLAVYHDKENFKEGLYYVRKQDYVETDAIRLWNEFVQQSDDIKLKVLVAFEQMFVYNVINQ